MGQRTATEALFGLIAAFVEKHTWSQANLARRLETKPETVRKQLAELKAGGFKLEREEDHPHVYWSVPKNWLPGVLHFKAEEAADLLRLLGRAPRGALRTRVLGVVLSRLQNFGAQSAMGSIVGGSGATADSDDSGVRAPGMGVPDVGAKSWAASIAQISWALHVLAPDYFAPYAFVHRFHHFEASCAS